MEQQFKGRMDRIRGRVRSTWGSITDDDVDKAQGDTERLVGIIREKTGEGIEEIRRKLEDMDDDDRSSEETYGGVR